MNTLSVVPSGNAKELVDRSLSGELGVLPGYGNKKTIVWNSPYGIVHIPDLRVNIEWNQWRLHVK